MKHALRARHSALRPIVSALIAILGSLPLQSAAAPGVANCNDSGPGSLRESVLGASDPDTIDLTQLQCTISLTTGALVVGQNSLTIHGSGSDKLTIDGSQNKSGDNIFLHTGSGALQIDHVAIRHGSFYLNDGTKYIGGGCIGSKGSVTLSYATVSNCKMTTGAMAQARGGAVFAQNDIDVAHSIISDNGVYSGASFGAGGGLFAHGNITIDHSTIANNTAPPISGGTAPNLLGGGALAVGTMSVEYSTISGNAAGTGAAIRCAGSSLYVRGSTISGNHGYSGGAIFTSQAVATSILNSTISGNTAVSPGPSFPSTPALTLHGPATISNSTIAFNVGQGARAAVSVYSGYALKMYSTIVADNFPADVYLDATSTLGGAYNLIVTSFAPLTASSISTCPKLEPLASNGGPTQTHALQQTSPAIDTGVNQTGAQFDQRGSGYPRKSGARADMGAFEWQGGTDDAIFASGFDFPSGFCELR